MANIEHKNITDPDIHEPKGVASASAGEVYIADGLGSGAWGTPEYSNDIVFESQFVAASADSQQPTGLDTPLQITFGPAQSTTDVSLSASGAMTINTAGLYILTFNGRIQRTTAAGEAVLMVRYLVNGTPQPYTVAHMLDDGDFSIPFLATRFLYFPAGVTLTAEIMRDSSGENNGGLEPFTPAVAGWAPVPSATIRLERIKVE